MIIAVLIVLFIAVRVVGRWNLISRLPVFPVGIIIVMIVGRVRLHITVVPIRACIVIIMITMMMIVVVIAVDIVVIVASGRI